MAVVSKLSEQSREAIAENKDIQNKAQKKKVMLEILSATISYLEGVFGPDTPRQKHTRHVADLLAREYPAMFDIEFSSDAPDVAGYGLGGTKGLEYLPERICNMVICLTVLNTSYDLSCSTGTRIAQ